MPEILHVIDVDGTAADNRHRAHYVERPDPDWKAFSQPDLVAQDKPIPEAVAGITRIVRARKPFLFLTGRGTDLHTVTRWWLKRHIPILQERDFTLITRASEFDGVPSSEFKPIALKRLGHTPVVCYDDEDHNLVALAPFGLALKAPECWPHVMPDLPKDAKPEVAWRPRKR